jgi:hypothetical protein
MLQAARLMRQAPIVDQVSGFGAAIPDHFQRVDAIDLGIALRVVLII